MSATSNAADELAGGSRDPGEEEQSRKRGQSTAEPVLPDFTGKTCFVIMPYGNDEDEVKDGAGNKSGAKSSRQHFDDVYEFICDIVDELKIKALRSDRQAEATPIHGKMLTDIIDADLAIVDITGRNPNVFYELGVRHTARRNATLLIGFGKTLPPFNLSGIRVHSYDLWDDPPEADPSRGKSAALKAEAARKALREAVIANLSSRATDSLVHALIPGLNLSRPQQPLRHDRVTIPHTFKPSVAASKGAAAKRSSPPTFTLGIIKGDLVDIDAVDVLVNPESTRMEMARIHDSTVSAFIRYHGARRDRQGNVIRDEIHEHLQRQVRRANVEPGTVIVTPPGKLKSQNVRAIFHVAAQHGEPCSGYHTIRSYTKVVSNALDKMDELNASVLKRWRLLGSARRLTSIVFPLLGTRGSELDPIEVTVDLVQEARKYLTLWPDTHICGVYFLAYTKRDLELCEAAFQRLGMRVTGDQSKADRR